MKTYMRQEWLRRAGCNAIVMLAAGVLVGCSYVYTDEPVGNTPVTLDPAEWDGCWASPQEVLQDPGPNDSTGPREPECYPCGHGSDWVFACSSSHLVTVVDPAEGLLQVVVRNHDGTASTLRAWVRSVERTSPPGEALTAGAATSERPRVPSASMFITIDDPDAAVSGDPAKLVFARMAHTGDGVLVWLPDDAAFRQVVRAGGLPGDTEANRDDDVTLHHLDDEALGVMSQRWDLFTWDEPGVLVRVKIADRGLFRRRR
jgi:hypothetical protein